MAEPMDFGEIARKAAERKQREQERAKANGEAKQAAKPSFLLPWEFAAPQPPRLIKGLMHHGDELLLWGPPEAGKTFFMVDLACRWSCREPWRGRELDCGSVVYLVGERQQSVRDRILAWAIRNGKKLPELPVLALNRQLNRMRPKSGELQELADEILGIVDRHKLPPVIALVPDTIHSLSPGSKEDAQSFGWVIGNTDGLRQRRHFNVVVAAVANKLARIIWAVLSRDETYRAPA